MSALRLEVEAHIVTASATAVQNLTKCVQLAGVKIDELVVDGLASAEAVLTETEKELGVAVADIGAGTIDLDAVRRGLAVPHGRPAGRRQQRDQRRRDRGQDDAPGRRGAQGPPRDVRPAGPRSTRRSASRSWARTPAARSAARSCAGSSRPGCARRSSWSGARWRAAATACCRRGSSSPAAGAARGHRRARPRGPPDAGPGQRARPASAASSTRSSDPSYSTARRAAPLGRAPDRRWTTRRATSRRPAAGGLGRIRERDPLDLPVAGRQPVRSIELEVRTGGDRGFTDLTPACARFASEAAAGGDGLLNVFVPHATAGARDHRAGRRVRRRTRSRRSTGCCRATTAGGTATARPATAPITSCRCSPRRR